MPASEVANGREPLEDLFVGEGDYVVICGGTFGPFLNDLVARMWAVDAFGRGVAQVVRLERPWRVPPEESKDPSRRPRTATPGESTT